MGNLSGLTALFVGIAKTVFLSYVTDIWSTKGYKKSLSREYRLYRKLVCGGWFSW
jgi:hypothetical protein